MALPALYGINQLQRLRELVEALESVHAGDVLALGSLRESLAELDRMQRSYVAAPDEAFRQGMHNHLDWPVAALGILERSNFTAEVAVPRALLDSLAVSTDDRGPHRGRAADEATDLFEPSSPSSRKPGPPLTPSPEPSTSAAAGPRRGRQVSAAASRTTTLVVVSRSSSPPPWASGPRAPSHARSAA
jgi:hypothetical protein